MRCNTFKKASNLQPSRIRQFRLCVSGSASVERRRSHEPTLLEAVTCHVTALLTRRERRSGVTRHTNTASGGEPCKFRRKASRTTVDENLPPDPTSLQPLRRSKRLCVRLLRENGFSGDSMKASSTEVVSSELESDTDFCSSNRLCSNSNSDAVVTAPEDPIQKRKKTRIRRKSQNLDDKGDIRRSRKLCRKSSVMKPFTEDSRLESMEVDGGNEFPTMKELREAIIEIFVSRQHESPGGAQTLPGKKYAWLFEKFTPPPIRGLETISEARLSPRQCRCRQRRFLAPPTPRTMATRKRPLHEESNRNEPTEDRSQDAFWSKRALPRRLSFGDWDESACYSEDNVDEDLRKFHEAAAKQKARRREAMLRQMNRRPGELLRISDQTERKFAAFWKDMESEEGGEE